MPGTAILSPGAGYAVVVSISLGFAILMIGITKLQTRYTKYKQTNLAEFASASHSVKPGLVACACVSSWTWSATLLTSSAQAYSNGMGGGWFYGAGATVQIFLFSMTSAKIKQNAPSVHSFCVFIRCRWGKAAHLVFLTFSLLTSILVSAMLVTGGSATVTSLTGASTQAISIIMPLSVAAYVMIGGLRERFSEPTISGSISSTDCAFSLVFRIVPACRLYPHCRSLRHNPILHVQRLLLKRENRIDRANVRRLATGRDRLSD